MFGMKYINPKEHYNKRFSTVAFAKHDATGLTVFVADEKYARYTFHYLTPEEYENLKSAISCYMDDRNKADGLIVDFLVARYKKNENGDADQIYKLSEHNKYYYKLLKAELGDLTPQKATRMNPEKRRRLTEDSMSAEGFQDKTYFSSQQLEMNDSSQQYDASPVDAANGSSSNTGKEEKQDQATLERARTMSARITSAGKDEKQEMETDDETRTPLAFTEPTKGGLLKWCTLTQTHVLAIVPDPKYTVNAVQKEGRPSGRKYTQYR